MNNGSEYLRTIARKGIRILMSEKKAKQRYEQRKGKSPIAQYHDKNGQGYEELYSRIDFCEHMIVLLYSVKTCIQFFLREPEAPTNNATSRG